MLLLFNTVFCTYFGNGSPFNTYSISSCLGVNTYLNFARQIIEGFMLTTQYERKQDTVQDFELSIIESFELIRRLEVSVHSEPFINLPKRDKIMRFIKELLTKKLPTKDIIPLAKRRGIDLVNLGLQIDLLHQTVLTDMIVTTKGLVSRCSLQGQFITLWEQAISGLSSEEIDILTLRIFSIEGQRILVNSRTKTDADGCYMWSERQLPQTSIFYNLIAALRQYLSKTKE